MNMIVFICFEFFCVLNNNMSNDPSTKKHPDVNYMAIWSQTLFHNAAQLSEKLNETGLK